MPSCPPNIVVFSRKYDASTIARPLVVTRAARQLGGIRDVRSVGGVGPPHPDLAGNDHPGADGLSDGDVVHPGAVSGSRPHGDVVCPACAGFERNGHSAAALGSLGARNESTIVVVNSYYLQVGGLIPRREAVSCPDRDLVLLARAEEGDSEPVFVRHVIPVPVPVVAQEAPGFHVVYLNGPVRRGVGIGVEHIPVRSAEPWVHGLPVAHHADIVDPDLDPVRPSASVALDFKLVPSRRSGALHDVETVSPGVPLQHPAPVVVPDAHQEWVVQGEVFGGRVLSRDVHRTVVS